MSATTIFEKRVKRLALQSLNDNIARRGQFRDVSQLEQWASGWSAAPSAEGVIQIANYFKIAIPPGYGLTPRAA